MNWKDNLTGARPAFVTHLECGLTGERYEADVRQNPVACRSTIAGSI